MLILGVDPDLHCTAFTVVDELDVLHWYSVIRVPPELKGDAAVAQTVDSLVSLFSGIPDLHPDVILVEGQEFYKDSEVDANALLKLARAGGAAALACKATWQEAFLAFVPPKTWTGQRAKLSRHCAIYSRMEHDSWNAFVRQPKSKLLHLLDAAGLAMWGHSDNGRVFLRRARAHRQPG